MAGICVVIWLRATPATPAEHTQTSFMHILIATPATQVHAAKSRLSQRHAGGRSGREVGEDPLQNIQAHASSVCSLRFPFHPCSQGQTRLDAMAALWAVALREASEINAGRFLEFGGFDQLS